MSSKFRYTGAWNPAAGASTPLIYLIAGAIASFLATYLLLPWIIKSLRGTPAMGRDLHKPGKPLIPEMGGLAVILGFYVGVSVMTIVPMDTTGGSTIDALQRPYFYAALSASLGAGVVGLLDDMFSLRKRTKAVLPFLLALPLGTAVAFAGHTALLGFDIGVLMVPAVAFGVTSAANAANMLEGFNGLGAGLALIVAVSLVILSIIEGPQEAFFLLFPLIGALVAFLSFNRYPARIFPGDSMTLFAGATLASAVIISSPSLKSLGALFFIPMVLEFFLKARGHFRGENFGHLAADGTLEYEGRTESLTHIVMKHGRHTEAAVVRVLWLFEAILALAILASAWWVRFG